MGEWLVGPPAACLVVSVRCSDQEHVQVGQCHQQVLATGLAPSVPMFIELLKTNIL
jgi:hypothetical protein